ncbi:MAG: hypothetical protein DRP45_00885 [Candidatus Zixiibacteriota bacterium]|nr:MAG: hypothetical protein DRP45_00885 [candidate division Zixibacteria bacterium]
MKTLIVLSALFALPLGSLHAQEYSPPYEYSTSSAPSTVTYFNFDITDSLYYDPAAVNELIYRDQPETAWNSADMNEAYQACSTFTYSGSISYQPPSNMLEWYFRSENDTVVVSQSPKNNDDLFPVPVYLMADLGADAIGDVEGGGSHLDITHCYGSYSDSKLYFRLDNNGGGFPTSGGLFTYYLYSVGMINPSSTDSVAYILLYANNPLYSTGLYIMDMTDSSLTNIGSVTTNISGNSLSMSCNIADLTAQPEWPEWPPEAGFVGVAPVTTTATITDMSTNDVGKSGLFIPSSYLLDFAGANTIPVLTDQNVSYDNTGLVTTEITYTDAENNLAVLRSLHFESIQYDMLACEKDYENGALFSTSLTVTEDDWYRYYFEFSDGVETVSTLVDSIYIELVPPTCCIPPSVGDLDQSGGDLGFNYDGADLSMMINGLFIDPTNGWDGICLDEADIDFSSERPVTDPLTVDGADLSILIDALFVDPSHFLKNCDGTDNW